MATDSTPGQDAHGHDTRGHSAHDAEALALGAGTTRELNFNVITFVTILFVLLLVITIAGGTGWFRWEYNRAQARAADLGGLNADLVRLQEEQQAHLDGRIDAAVAAVAEEY